MHTIEEKKIAWRHLASEQFSLVNRNAWRRLDHAISEKVAELVETRKSRTLLGFACMPDEPDLSAYFRHWLEAGGRLALPVWKGGATMKLRYVTNLDAELHPGRGGILVPMDGLPDAEPGEIDLAVVPGRFFSENCDRMGRGAGCYDGLFRDNPKMARVGVAYDFQIYPEVPVEDGDETMDMVVTPSRLIMKKSDDSAANNASGRWNVKNL